MRSDYLLYLLALVFFMLAAVSLALVADQAEKTLWVVATVILGLVSLGLGYYQRSKTKATKAVAPNTTEEFVDPHIKEAHIAEDIEKHAEPTTTPVSVSPMPTQLIAPIPAMTPTSIEVSIPLKSELLAIKGIGEKRATQLKELRINNISDLANASPEDLARNLTISPKITQKWVKSAKELQNKTPSD